MAETEKPKDTIMTDSKDGEYHYDTSMPLYEVEQREMDGTGNNPYHDSWGSADNQFIRLTPKDYEDGVSANWAPRTNYRDLSDGVVKQNYETTNSHGVSDLFTFFGQFIDHDIDLALEDEYGDKISVETPYFGTGEIAIHRSEQTYPNSGEHANAITSYIDASNVYGSDETKLAELRDPDSPWLMKMSAYGNLLPIGEEPNSQFEAGDVRAGENSALTSMHTIWAKEHNYHASHIKEKHPDWTDQQVFDSAKVMVEALMQQVVYKEWLPKLVGEYAIPEYTGYDAHVDPTISHEFATAAFRFGHSLLSSDIHRIDEKGYEAEGGHLQLAQMFFNAAILKDEGSIDTLIRGIASTKAEELDHHIVEDVRSFLFAGPEGPGLDLAVLNLLRGVDHGIGTLNDVRESLGYARYQSFKELTGGDKHLAKELSYYYDSVDDVDLWIGGLIEEKEYGSQLGETFQHIVLDQFMRLRDGDSNYYETRLAGYPELLEEIQNTSFSDIILRNTDIQYLQDDAFIAHHRVSGDDSSNTMYGSAHHDLMMGWGGDDTMYGRKGDDDIYGGDGDDKLYGGSGNDKLDGEGGHDRVYGQKGDDEIWTRDGDDRAEGGSGNDWIDTGIGNDKIWGQSGQDKIWAQDGEDYVDGGDDNDWIDAGYGNDIVYGARGADDIWGNDGEDEIYGGRGKDLIDAGEGHDEVYGGKGVDKIYAQGGNDYVKGGEHDDEVYGGYGDDYIKGGRGNDYLDGGYGSDEVYGGKGNDVINGSWGDDHLYGNGGKDMFVFGKDSGHDYVYDFNKKNDMLDVSEYGIKSMEDVYNSATETEEGTVLTLDSEYGDSVTLVGVKLYHLSDKNFVYDEMDPMTV